MFTSRLHTALKAFMLLFFMMISGAAFACGDGSCDPKPDPVETTVKHEGRDVACLAGSDEVAVLKRVEKLAVGEDVTVRDGDRTVIARGGDHVVVKVLSSRRVCVTKESAKKTTSATTSGVIYSDEIFLEEGKYLGS